MIFVSLIFVVNGGLYGTGKVMTPVIALVIGSLIKLGLNILLISNPDINIYGAAISSIVCQAIVFAICYNKLNKEIKLDINFKNHIFKPVISAGIMGAGVWGAYYLLYSQAGVGNTVSTLVAILTGAIIYGLAILITKSISKDELHMMPLGPKAYKALVKVGIYK